MVRASARVALLPMLLAACGPTGSGGSGGNASSGGNGAAAQPAERRILSFTDAAGATVPPNEILTKARFIVPRGDDLQLFTPVGGDIFGTPDIATVRLGKDGSVKWARRYHFPEVAFIGGAVDDGQGISFVAGQDATVYVVRIDDTGAIRAQQAYEVPGAGQNSATVPLTLASLEDGGLLVGTGNGAMRLAADGGVMWAHNAGGGVQRLAVLPGGDFAFVGDLGGMRVARLAPDGTKRFIGAGGIKGNFFHAGIAPTSDGGFLVVSGVDASDAHVSTVTGRFSADGKTGTFEGVSMDVLDDMGYPAPMQFGAGYHVQRAADGRVWASVEMSSGALGSMVRGQAAIAFDDGKPTDAVFVGLAFAVADGLVTGLSPDGLHQDVLLRVPRPQKGACAVEPIHLASNTLASASYELLDAAAVSPIDVQPVAATVEVSDLTATLSADDCQ